MLECTDRNRNHQAVVEEGPEKVLFDIFDCCPACSYKLGNFHQGVVHQYYVGGVHCNVGAAVDADADITQCKSRGVVDAVADHHDPVAFGLKLLDYVALFGRQNARNNMLYACLSSYFLRCLLIIAREHYRLDIEVMKHSDKSVNVIPDNIVDADD